MKTTVYKESEYCQFVTQFFCLIPLEEAKQYVCSFIGFFLTWINLKMIPKELLGSPDLRRAQTLYIYKLTKVVMVNKNKDFMFTIF